MKEKQEFLIQGNNGYEISCLEWAQDTFESTVVCLHGFAGDKYSSVIEALANDLTAKSTRVIAFDWPGHGNSPTDGSNFNVDNCMRDLDSVLEYVGNQEKLYLFATSFGGYVAINYLLKKPLIFEKVILRSPAINMFKTFLDCLTPEDLEIINNGGVVNKGINRELLLGKPFYDNLIKYNIENAVVEDQGLVIQGNLDNIVSPTDSYEFAHRNGWDLHIVYGADHRYKHPGEVDEIISATNDFLNKKNCYIKKMK